MAKKAGSEHHAKWVCGTKCEHSESDYWVIEIRWIRVPMSNSFWRGTAEVGRWVVGIATLGTSTWFNGGIKDLSHECIEILATCKRCGKSLRFTAEIHGQNDTSFRCGYYSREYNARNTYKPPSMTLDYMREKYNEIGKNYDLVFENCYTWCSALWERL